MNWNKYQSKVTIPAQNLYLNYLVDPSFQGVNKTFVRSFHNTTDRAVHTKHYLTTVEIKDYNLMINGRNFSYQSVKNNLRTYDNIRKIATG